MANPRRVAISMQASVATGATAGRVSQNVRGPARLVAVTVASHLDVAAAHKVYLGRDSGKESPTAAREVGTNLLTAFSSEPYLHPGTGPQYIWLDMPLPEGINFLKVFIDNQHSATVFYSVIFEVELGEGDR